MELVELTSIRESLVGFPGVNGFSTKQRKRLTIVVELVANPSIILMDEPTSGLNAKAASIVIRTVRNTVDTGRTIVNTIHQPSIDIFMLSMRDNKDKQPEYKHWLFEGGNLEKRGLQKKSLMMYH